MRRAVMAAAAVVMIPVLAALAGQSYDRGGGRSFQLVYHSDTRGYYRPCG
jgi:hypothetical protein